MTPLEGIIAYIVVLCIFLPPIWYLDREAKKLKKQLEELNRE